MFPSNKIILDFSPKNLRFVINIVLWIFLLITIIAVFVPFSPKMPTAGLDPSWMFGMNQATAQGLAFGKDMIFTFGPYASIYTKTYQPVTDFMMLSGSLYLALSYWACLLVLIKDVQLGWILALCIAFTGLMYLPDPLLEGLPTIKILDPLLLSYPLLVGLLSFKVLFWKEGRLVNCKWTPFYVALLFSTLGFLLLIKGSILILSSVVITLCSVLFIANRLKFLAIICLLSPMVSLLFFLVVSGQSVENLADYFISMANIVSGYTEAMATNALEGNVYEVVLYLMASAFLLLAISLQSQLTRTAKLFLFCLYFIFLFISFKAGFVRHDGHAIISGTSILISALLLPFILNTQLIIPVMFFAILTWFAIDNNYSNTSTKSIAKNVNLTYSSMWHGIKHRIENKNWPKIEFDAAMSTLRKQASFPVLSGTTDIYSYNQSYLIASGNTWSPRPILQSYSVYTPELAEINRKHLLGNQAPNNIIFSVEPIDERIPSLEDGASWPILILNYRPTQMKNNFLFLKKKAYISDIEQPLKLTSENHIFGELVNLPESKLPVFAQIEIKPTLLGRIANMLFKPSQLQITLVLNNDLKKQFRIIAGMAKSGFVLSPLIENTTEFKLLYGENDLLDNKQVKSLVIKPRNGKTMLWNNEYMVIFSQIKTSYDAKNKTTLPSIY